MTSLTPNTSQASHNSARSERRLRLASGLIMAVFVCMHLTNHALGLISIDAMEWARRIHLFLWENPVGKVVLFFAFISHFMLALLSLYRRSTLRMPLWEATQMGFGFAIPFMLAGHIIGAEIIPIILGYDIDFPYVVGALWSDEWLRIKQPLLIIIVWVHVTIGLHFWLRLKNWYRRLLPVLYALAVILPVLAILGFIRAGMDMQNTLSYPYPTTYAELFTGPLATTQEQQHLIRQISNLAPMVIILLILLTVFTRSIRLWLARRQPRYTLHHPTAGKLQGLVGQSVLEVLRTARVPHASVCGGRARCTTCRINVDRSYDLLAPPSTLEASALKRINAGSMVRLACQTRPKSEIWITPLLPPSIQPTDYQGAGGISGNEQEVVAMFVDLRGFSSFAESRLPFDVVLILNQFFGHMSAALESRHGHYAQFTGDGLFALFGLQGDIKQACREALSSAVEMQHRLERLNQHIEDELKGSLRIGIGIHCGEAIVGPMGPPSSRVVSAIGDSVNIASRLEAATKQFNCIALVSQDTIKRAELKLIDVNVEKIDIRGREQRLAVYPIYEIETLNNLSDTASNDHE